MNFRWSAFFVVIGSLVLFSGAVEAQDVELLGEAHGTRPPPAYYDQIQRDPSSFQFHREGLDRLDFMLDAHGLRDPSSLRPRFQMEGMEEPTRSPIGPRDGPMEGEFPFPLILGLFHDSPEDPPFSKEDVQREFFDGPNSRYQTVTEFYREMSGGRAELRGETFEWTRVELTREEVTGGVSGLSAEPAARVASFIEEIVQKLDADGVDWSIFDHTGDGFVDVLTIMHPTPGAECASGDRDNRIWSHRWEIQSASGGRLDPGIETSTPRPNGDGNIYIRDYTIQPVYSCDGTEINEIGVFAHEMGHAFGLPDLYCTGRSCSHRGAGNWDLMGTGTWGCSGGSPHRPCHLGAWGKKMLGWVDVEVVEPGLDHGTILLDPVLTGGGVLQVESGDGSGEYLLLENRQRVGSDSGLFHSGLLIWHINPDVVDGRWRSNSVNNDPERMGIWLRQADGSNSLTEAGGGRGSPGDPFPGCQRTNPLDHSEPCVRNREFHAGSDPGSWSQEEGVMGITLFDIDEVGASGSEPRAVEFRLLTRFQEVVVRADGLEGEGGTAASPGLGGWAGVVTIDGGESFGEEDSFRSAPFQTHEIVAAPAVELTEDVRKPFQEWLDGAPRERTFTTALTDTLLVAHYGEREVRVALSLETPVEDVSPGEVLLTPSTEDHWVPEGAEVTVEARPRTGFVFREWKGALTDGTNPTSLVVDTPIALEAAFSLVYGIADAPGEVEMEAARPYEITLQVDNANDPVQWTVEEGSLPEGLAIDGGSGLIFGAALQSGAFSFEVKARDAIGLEARAPLTFRVNPPVIEEADLLGPFLGTGRSPSAQQEEYLDRQGNRNGSYDLGDLRAYLQEGEGTVPVASSGASGALGAPVEAGLVEILVPLGPVSDPGADDAREAGRAP